MDHPHSIIANHCLTLRETTYVLRDLADALATVGNDRLSERLYTISKAVYEAERGIHSATGTWVSEGVRQAESGSRAVVEAAIAGLALAKPQ